MGIGVSSQLSFNASILTMGLSMLILMASYAYTDPNGPIQGYLAVSQSSILPADQADEAYSDSTDQAGGPASTSTGSGFDEQISPPGGIFDMPLKLADVSGSPAAAMNSLMTTFRSNIAVFNLPVGTPARVLAPLLFSFFICPTRQILVFVILIPYISLRFGLKLAEVCSSHFLS